MRRFVRAQRTGDWSSQVPGGAGDGGAHGGGPVINNALNSGSQYWGTVFVCLNLDLFWGIIVM